MLGPQRKFGAVMALLALALSTTAFAQGGDQGPPPTAVRVGAVKQQTLQARWEVVGRLRALKRSHVAAEREGRVIELAINEGDHVEAGDSVLARLDDVWAKLDVRVAEAQLAESRAAVKEAEADLDQAERDLNQLEGLLEARSAKPKEVEDARTTVEATRARLNRARANVMRGEAELARRKEALQRLVIAAPFDGVVTEKLTEVGQWVAAGAPVVEMISRGQIDAILNVPEDYVNNIGMGDPVEIVVNAINRREVGEVVAITPSGVNAARTFPVKVRLPDQEGALKPGMTVTAAVPMGKTDRFTTVPRDAVQFTPYGARVWTTLPAEGEGMPQAMSVQVEVEFPEGDRYAVRPFGQTAGLLKRPDAVVVVEGAETLFPTRPLIIQNTGAPQGGAPASAQAAADDRKAGSDPAAATATE